MEKFNIGFDIHGLIDSDPQLFSFLSKLLVESGCEVHILTGKHIEDGVLEELKKYKITYTHLFSIADYHKLRGEKVRYDDKNTPWIEKELWDRAKAEYCDKHNIRLHLDDSEVYGQHFKTSYGFVKIKVKK